MREGGRRKAVHAAIGFCIALVLTAAGHSTPSALLDQTGRSHLKGVGWTLDLASGWNLVPAAQSGSFIMKKE